MPKSKYHPVIHVRVDPVLFAKAQAAVERSMGERAREKAVVIHAALQLMAEAEVAGEFVIGLARDIANSHCQRHVIEGAMAALRAANLDPELTIDPNSKLPAITWTTDSGGTIFPIQHEYLFAAPEDAEKARIEHEFKTARFEKARAN